MSYLSTYFRFDAWRNSKFTKEIRQTDFDFLQGESHPQTVSRTDSEGRIRQRITLGLIFRSESKYVITNHINDLRNSDLTIKW